MPYGVASEGAKKGGVGVAFLLMTSGPRDTAFIEMAIFMFRRYAGNKALV